MIFKEIVSEHLLEVLLIAISAYVAVKTYGNRNSSRVTKAFSSFAAANMIFQALDLCMALNRSGICLNGHAIGSFIYVVTLIAMAYTGYCWFIYVEEATGAKTFDKKIYKFLWSIPLIVFALMCTASVKTGWIFSFGADGKYVIGSLFIIQYVVIFGYCLMAMIRSAVNYFVKKEKRVADRTLLMIMLIDTIAVAIQLSFMVNMMNTALVLTVLLSYMTVYSSELEQIKLCLDEERRINQDEEGERKVLAENNARLFALEDNFMSLYDVELESGQYVSFERDEFYKRNISDKVISMTEFFKDLRTNVDNVVYEKDREATFEVQQKENIISALSVKDHIDHYYRVITDNGLMWLKMRIVYKDALKKNVIIGVFNAEEEMEARQKDERIREELFQTNSRLFALEDNFESLYDIELESGHYESFVKGDFYQKNVNDKLVAPGDYFEDLKGNIDAVIYEEDKDGLYSKLTRESIRKELAVNDHFDYFYRINAENGPVWFKLRIVYKDEEKNNIIIGVFNAEKDVETQQLIEQKKLLEIAREEADRANKSKTDFLFNMSHDIRTPMNAITGFTAMAKKYSYDQDKVNDYLDKIDTSGRQLLTLVNQVLEMARIESGHVEVNEDPVNIRKEFSTMVTVLSEQALSKSLNFKYDLDIQHSNVFADEARMNSITLNIVGNALKYTPEGGIIEFRLKEIPGRKEGYASYILTVADTGIGMSEAFQTNLFEPFEREQSSTVSRIQGTGLGMTIVKKLVDFLGGDIEVKSELGKGTRFDITVDFRINENIEEEPETVNEIGTSTFKSLKVLLTEDNELNREIAKDILEEEGFTVEEAEDGSVAVEMLREKGPDYYDFILMDIQMPFMNGFEATRAIREMYPDADIPIIALSANAFEEDKKAALDAGMNDHVAKPIEIVKLFGVLAKYL